MVRFTLRLFGVPVLSVDRVRFEFVEEESPAVGGGSSHNFERDCDPLSPTSHHEWEWEEEGFGFR